MLYPKFVGFEAKLHLGILRLLFLLLLLPHVSMGQDASSSSTLPQNKAKEKTAPAESMETRSHKFRLAAPEPKIFTVGSTSQWMGVYFGSGFRQIQFTFQPNHKVESKDSSANGVGFNLGVFLEEQAFEFSRQVSLISVNPAFEYGGHSWTQIEVQQNNFSFFAFPKITSKWYAHYGGGVQFAQIRSAKGENFVDETAANLSVGTSFFLTPNLVVLYRFSHSFFLPINKKKDEALLLESQFQTVFLDYYFPL